MKNIDELTSNNNKILKHLDNMDAIVNTLVSMYREEASKLKTELGLTAKAPVRPRGLTTEQAMELISHRMKSIYYKKLKYKS